MLAVLPSSTPLLLSRNTCPLAVRLPKICVGLPPCTRLRTTEVVVGWLKVIVAAEPMSNADQVSAMREEVWSTTRVVPLAALMVPVPPTMLPPVGSWLAATWARPLTGMAISAAASARASGR